MSDDVEVIEFFSENEEEKFVRLPEYVKLQAELETLKAAEKNWNHTSWSKRLVELESRLQSAKEVIEFYSEGWQRIPNVGFDTFAHPGEDVCGERARKWLEENK